MKRIISILSATLIFALFLGTSLFASTDEAKIDKVLEQMSSRAKKEIVINNKTEFLKDLQTVLDFEKETSKKTGDLGYLYLIDKKNGRLSENYVPKNLVSVENKQLYKVNKAGMLIRADVKAKLEEMVRAYDKDTGAALFLVSSAYRSYEYQKNLFQHWVNVDGLEEAERESARAGTSQHQLGVALDFGSITNEFATTKQGKWMYDNAWKYGWSLSFPKGYEDITGFMWESWHFRYVGTEACKLQRKYFNDVQQYMLEFIDLWKKN